MTSYAAQVWHAVGRDRKPLRKQYLEAILPPFVAILRRWRPLLAGIHELTSLDGQNPLIVDDRALAADALPLEVISFGPHVTLLSHYRLVQNNGYPYPYFDFNVYNSKEKKNNEKNIPTHAFNIFKK